MNSIKTIIHLLLLLLLSNSLFAQEIKEDFTTNSTAKNDKIKLMVGAKAVLDWTQKEKIQNFIKQQEEKEQETPPQQQTSTPIGQEQQPQQKKKEPVF